MSGIRIIAFLKEDCQTISQLLRDNFTVDIDNSMDKEVDIDPDRFGYQSIHLILSYSEERTNLKEFRRFAGLKFEVQVKTLLQHTWSTIDWKLRYKTLSEAPRKLRRRLFRIAALLDAADDELSYVVEQASKAKSDYEETIQGGDLPLEIDRDSVDALLANRLEEGGSIDQILKKLNPVPGKTTNEAALNGSAEAIFEVMKLVGVKTLHQLDEKINSFDDRKIELLQTALTGWMNDVKISTWKSSQYDIPVFAMIFAAEPSKAAQALRAMNFVDPLKASIRNVLQLPDPADPAS